MFQSDDIPFSGVISRDVYIKAQLLNSSKNIWLFRLVLAVAAVIVAVSAYSNGDYVFSVIIAGFGILYIPVIFAIRKWHIVRTYEKSPYLHEQSRGVLSETQFYVEAPLGTCAIPWRNIIKVRANNDLLLLYPGPNIFYILTREFFASDSDWMKARELVMRQVPN